MDAALTDTIDKYGDPLAFKIRAGADRAALLGHGGIIKVEARQMALHQKEAVVTEGRDGSAWRLTSDEGRHLKGTDLAPFPLGFFNAGVQSDLYGRIRALAAARKIEIDDIKIRLVNHYWLTGSFVQGTGEGHAEAPDIEVDVRSAASPEAVASLIGAALDASPAIAFIRSPLTANSFALYVNGRRRDVEGIVNSPATNVDDPYRVHAAAPRPLDADARRDLIEKTGAVEQGTIELALPTIANRQIRNVVGDGTPAGRDGLFRVDTFLALPGVSHFRLIGDEGIAAVAPTGLALLSAGVAFCYMTQLARYIENMKMNIRHVRLVQFTPFTAGARASAGMIDTHLFLNGEAPIETHLKLLTIAARTCYLHATAKTPVDPIVRIVHNGVAVAKAA